MFELGKGDAIARPFSFQSLLGNLVVILSHRIVPIIDDGGVLDAIVWESALFVCRRALFYRLQVGTSVDVADPKAVLVSDPSSLSSPLLVAAVVVACGAAREKFLVRLDYQHTPSVFTGIVSQHLRHVHVLEQIAGVVPPLFENRSHFWNQQQQQQPEEEEDRQTTTRIGCTKNA